MPGVLHWVALLRHFQKTHVLNSVFLLLTAQDGRWSMTVLVTFVHLCLPLPLETRNVCDALRAQARGEVPQTEALVRVAGSLGRQVMHSRGFEGRTHERSHDPHDRHQFLSFSSSKHFKTHGQRMFLQLMFASFYRNCRET